MHAHRLVVVRGMQRGDLTSGPRYSFPQRVQKSKQWPYLPQRRPFLSQDRGAHTCICVYFSGSQGEEGGRKTTKTYGSVSDVSQAVSICRQGHSRKVSGAGSARKLPVWKRKCTAPGQSRDAPKSSLAQSTVNVGMRRQSDRY